MPATARLPVRRANDKVLAMYTVARFLQMVGLTIPLLAIVAQLQNAIKANTMLGFLVASVLIFSIGQVLQRYTGGQ